MRINKKLPLLCVLAGLNVCIFSTAIADNIQDAEQAIEKQDYSTAIIHLKNQLKKTPKNAHARFLLGKAYLSTGKLESSLKELGRAYEISPKDTHILFAYVDILQAMGKQEKVLKLLDTPFKDSKLESQRLSYIGYAHLASKQVTNAREAFEKSNKLEQSAKAYNGLIALSLFEKNYTLAEELLKKSTSIDPENNSTLLLKAKLANLNKQPDQALEIYNELIKNNPENLSYYLERATTLSLQDKKELAKKDLNVILSKYPNYPQANFLMSEILLREKAYEGAQKSAQLVVNASPQHMPATFVLGAANFALKNYNQAEENLTIYLASKPDNLKAQNLLANIYLAQDKTEQSLLIIEGIPKKQLEKDPLLLTTLGSTYIKKGDTTKGLQFLNQAQALEPNNQDIRKRIIAIQFQSGELKDAISELEELTSKQTGSDQSHAQTNYLLIISYIKQEQFDKADEKIEQFLLKTPEDLKLLNLKALTLQLKGHPEKAMAQYQAIIKQDKDNIPAYMGLARLSALESNWSESENYFKQVLKIEPNTLKAYLGLAAIADKQDKEKETEQYFFDAIERSNKNIPSQLTVAELLSQWYQSKQQPEKILHLAEKLDKQHSNNNNVRSFLARAQLLNQQNDRAERTIKSILTYDTKDVKHRILLAQIISNDKQRIDEAITLLDEALLIQPKNQVVYTLKASLLIKQGKNEEAATLVKTMQEKFPESTTAQLLNADIYRAQKQYKKALAIYQEIYKKEPNNKIFSAIISVLLSLNQQDKAVLLLTEKVNASSSPDIDDLFKLASLHHEKKQLDKAEVYYQKVLEKNPKHVLSLNNLAWIKIDSNTKEAVKLAKQAYDQAPKSAAIIDTYGYFLVRDEQYEAGLDLLKQAAEGIPEDKDIQYHLAYAYAKLGQQKKAQQILETIVHSKQSFSEQKKAQQLYQEVK
ncbi:MAG: PEP-CTERM system TPR-repeat protein PrsT [Gammaproteobacteria bacterium]|nr:PEP-CTERM system TPR-repeat protein PrsT [Gammaproteobacteria bacterium]